MQLFTRKRADSKNKRECECPYNSKKFNKTSTWDHMLGDDSSIEKKYDYIMFMASDKVVTS